MKTANPDSLNHYSKGAVFSFLHTRTAGIRPLEPAYRRFLRTPRPGGGLRSAEAEHHSPYGRIASACCIDEDGTFQLTATVPAGTRAEILLPDGTTAQRGPGIHHFTAGLQGCAHVGPRRAGRWVR
ncbi:alpha-L-rhamnosidase C-terminal domain-containing protein [Streptomyces sp. NBC_00989]|uniref:alpha-L-rhamnosidase C-terminal domain-containing protein n=1 Tax=Streptomyces sp. NBC_00989 TaxID=2903705 RepID=UPI003869FDB7|nr:hypothetical protein OG714_01910 [Streptomyces sp. NBC_00989]